MTNTPAAPDTATEPVKVLAYKGFAPDLTCDPTGENPFQYAEGQTYEHDGDVSVCNSGFHACTQPIHVLRYYPPASSVYHVVELEDVASRAKPSKGSATKESNGAATASGEYGAATASGEESIAIATGRDGKARGALGCWIVLTERDSDWHILEVRAVKVDGEQIKPDAFYKLTGGRVVEA